MSANNCFFGGTLGGCAFQQIMNGKQLSPPTANGLRSLVDNDLVTWVCRVYIDLRPHLL